ncbi:MAG TPA: hypothetical protein VKX45_03495 [Bryobacteraceae bacterium]|nr:hypothetical protein [Bryobacteraceae bacterium]
MVRVQFVLRRTAAPPAGDALVAQPAVQRGRLPRITQLLAQAILYEDMLRRGVGNDFADLARLAGLSRERIGQLARLLWLAPDIQREVLSLPRTPSGRFPVGEPALRKVASRLRWSEQRQMWAAATGNSNGARL